MNTGSTFSEKDMLDDTLSTLKFITGNYNTNANECACPELRETFLCILNAEHQTQADVFCEMSNRGWYQTQPAEQNKIQQAKQKFMAQG